MQINKEYSIDLISKLQFQAIQFFLKTRSNWDLDVQPKISNEIVSNKSAL